MNDIFKDDPYVDPAELRAANERHDQQNHEVSMWQRANYRGRFGYPPDPKPKPRRKPTEDLRSLAE